MSVHRVASATRLALRSASPSEPLPVVNETRPPKTSSAAGIEASTTLEAEQPAIIIVSSSSINNITSDTQTSHHSHHIPGGNASSSNSSSSITPQDGAPAGLAYHLEWVDKAGSFDEEVVQDGVKVLIDSKALFSIIGSEMDWVEDKLSQRFVFKNPNIKEECGCGESFMV
ncbi:hypothetical protein VdG1_08936 [Verticillium dahliae VDG1]|nr:hypothetical protein VdG1_08936 [Verticillium dahliae VDG1]